MNKMLLALAACLVLTVSTGAQQGKGQLNIQLNKAIFQPGDSLLLLADYRDSSGQLGNPTLATLELVIENEQGMRTRLRWPMIEGQASGALYLSDSLPRGKYTLFAGLQPRFFEVVGKVRDGRHGGQIQAMLLTKTGEWAEQAVPVAQDGSFSIGNWLFEENALMAFSGRENSKQLLDIRISTQLDSSFVPLAVAGRSFYVGNPPASAQANLGQTLETPQNLFADQGTTLPAVVVRATAKSRAEQFDEEYVSGLFRSGNERIVSIIDDPSALGFYNIFSYLQGRVAGLQITPAGFNGGMARWRGDPVNFFLDEVRTSAQQIANIPMSDIALVKAYPPPFIGAPGGGGAIAIYTRRGGERDFLPPNRQVFKVRGYTPASTTLRMDKLSM
ncbi:hypothetical protein [Pseudocnuella soli]|uniref:hypothetical protein n=1 Tax=Pseudocnuella soli TaxID=2502779 RepID=UPI0010525750|nr:hypothetical protein [Pseudocnuella soli]